MALLLPTHSVTISEAADPEQQALGYDTGSVVASGVPACIVRYAGSTSNPLDVQSDRWLLLLNPEAPLTRFNTVTDEASGGRYKVEDVAVRQSSGPFARLAHTRATIVREQA